MDYIINELRDYANQGRVRIYCKVHCYEGMVYDVKNDYVTLKKVNMIHHTEYEVLTNHYDYKYIFIRLDSIESFVKLPGS